MGEEALKIEELDYYLPPELIAQHPAEPRDHSRLLVYDRATGDMRHRRFRELPEELDLGRSLGIGDALSPDQTEVAAGLPEAQEGGEHGNAGLVLVLASREFGQRPPSALNKL